MTIHFFLQSRAWGGAERFAADLISSWQKNKQVVTLHTSNPHLLNLRRLPTHRLPIYLDLAGNLRGLCKSLLLLPVAVIYYLYLLTQIKKNTPTALVIASGFSEKIPLAIACRLLQLKLVIIEYGPLQPLFAKFGGLPRLLYHIVITTATIIITSSRHSKRAIQEFFPAQKIVVIACGSRLPRSNFAQLKPTHSLLCVSRMEADKGQDLLIQAFYQLQNRFPRLQLHLIGAGSKASELHQLAQDHPRIHFHHHLPDTQKLLRQAQVVVCPSVWELEGFGLVVTEAMAAGKTIVAFNRPPYNELLKHRQNALLAKNADVTDLSQQIALALQNKNLAQQLAQQAKQDFMNKYQIDQAALNYQQLLRQL